MKLVIFIVLLVSALTFETRLFSGENREKVDIGEIEKLTFLDEEVFFLNIDHKHFGYINKTNGQVTRLSTLKENEKIINAYQKGEIVLVNDKNLIFAFNITEKKGRKDYRMK